MGQIVVTEFITLDGVIEDPGGSEGFERGGWAFAFDRGAEGDAFKLGELETADAQLLGRKTYDGFAAAWPERTDEAGFADRMNSMPKFVVSKTLENPTWTNTTVIDGDLAAEIGKLRDRFDRDILVAGSAQLVQSLLQEGLVDELRLMVFPVVLGKGRRLFLDEAQRGDFDLAETRQTGSVAILTLRRK